MKVLVTGADGFIGSHLVEGLVSEGHLVKAFVYYNSSNSWGWLDALDKSIMQNVEVITGDIRDAVCVKQAMEGTEMVFHLAALIAIPYSYRAAQSYVDTNVSGTLNVVQAAKDLGISRVLVTSTSEVYGTAMYVPIDEKHPKQPQSPYSASKIGADAVADSFYRSFNLPLTIVRPFNTYGPRQSARAVIPTIITQLLTGKTEIRLGALSPTRDLLFVKDTVQGFISISKCSELIGHEVNIATNSEISVGDLAGTIIEQINPHAKIVSDAERLRPANSEVERLYGDNTKLRTMSNWKPQHTIEEGLAKTIEWFRDPMNLARYKADIYNV